MRGQNQKDRCAIALKGDISLGAKDTCGVPGPKTETVCQPASTTRSSICAVALRRVSVCFRKLYGASTG